MSASVQSSAIPEDAEEEPRPIAAVAQEDAGEAAAAPDPSLQKVQAVARLHPSWFKGKGAEAELKETAVAADHKIDPRLVTFKGQKIIFMGCLLKFGKTVFGAATWKKRFFVLTPDFLCKFNSKEDYMAGKNAEATIDLTGSSVTTAEQETSQPFSFKITCPNIKAKDATAPVPGSILVAAENAWELVEWTKSIENHGTRGWQSLITEASFQKLHKVGSGSFGSVFQVKKLDTQKIYAMKVLNKSNFTDENQLRSLSNERKVLEAVSHKFIVQLHFAFQSDEEYFFVLDFMAGGDFYAFLKRHRKLDESQMRFYAAEVLLALEYMHSYDPPIAYRDLKPENIMIGIDGHIKLTDFGFAKFFGEEGESNGVNSSDAGSPRRERSYSIVGSAYYIAPEIVVNAKKEGHDLSVDFWSFGCLMYEMVCGHALFCDPKSEALFQQMKKAGQIAKDSTFQQFTMHRVLHTRDNVSFPSSMTKPLVSLLSMLLQRNPDLRCKSWTEVKGHEFFKSIDFTKLSEKKLDPPFVPSLRNGYLDISMFEGATAVDISVARTPSKKREVAGSPTIQFHDFDFQAKISHLLTDSARKGPRSSGDAFARHSASEAPSSMGGMRRSRSSENLDLVSKQSAPVAPTLEPIQQSPQLTAIAATVEPAPLTSSGGLQSDSPPVPKVVPRAETSSGAGVPASVSTSPSQQITPQELAVQFFSACGWDSHAAAACLIDALAGPKNPSLASGKFQQAGAKFANEITSAIMERSFK